MRPQRRGWGGVHPRVGEGEGGEGWGNEGSWPLTLGLVLPSNSLDVIWYFDKSIVET